MKSSKFRGKKMLPHNFQEILMKHEMKFEKKEIDIDLVRNMIYLYSLAVEYYDSVNKNEFHEFYITKSKKLFEDPSVLKFLDNDKLLDTSDIHLFDDDNNNNDDRLITENITPVKRKIAISIDSFEDENDNKMSRYRMQTCSNFKTKTKRLFLDEEVKSEVLNLDKKLSKLEGQVNKQIDAQKDKFEELKRIRLQKQNEFMKLKNKITPENNDYNTSYSTNSTLIAIDEDIHMINKRYSIKETERQSFMLKEIEEYVEFNMKEMHKALEDLKKSYEDDINSLNDESLSDVVKGLKEDMKSEIEHLRELYEEQRRIQVEKIRAKFMKN